MSDWQPIATAPKDKDVLVAVFAGGDWLIGVAMYHSYASGNGGWWQWDWEYEPTEIEPRHWMPLPEPPK